MKNTNLNALAATVHANAKAKGFWDAPRNTGELFMLIISELGEALEAHRKGKFADWATFDIIYSGSSTDSWEHGFKTYIKDTFEDEIADVVIRILDYVGFRGDVRVDFAAYDKGPYQVIENPNVGEVMMDAVGFLNEAYGWAASHAFVETKESLALLEGEINAALILLYNLSVSCGFNLIRHIEAKMKFNATRERLHGKAY